MLKRSYVLLTAAAMTATLLVATPAAAAPAAGERIVTNVYALNGPQWFDAQGKLSNRLDPVRKGGSPETLGLKAATDRAPQAMTDKAAQKLAVRQGAEYGTASENLPKGGAQLLADDITPEECRDNSDQSARPEGWIKNHFSYCQLNAYVAVQQRCRLIFCVTIGYFEARVTLLGYGYNGLRNIDFTAHVDEVFFYGTTTLGLFTYEIDCAGSPNDDSCIPGSHEVSRTPPQWELDGEADLLFYSDAEPSSPSVGEQIDTGVFQAEVEFRFPSGGTRSADGPETSVRFDSAWYLAQKQGSIFNRVTPWLSYSVTDEPVKYAAWNIHNAQNFPAETEPFLEGKQLPGASAADPVHRLFHDKTRRAANRAEATGYCHTRWEGYSELGQDCDEYPFACSYEGAARYQYAYRGGVKNQFAVRPIPSADNQEAGRRLGTWFSADRIINDDPFYVRILGADSGTGPEPPTGTPAPPDAAVDCGDNEQ